MKICQRVSYFLQPRLQLRPGDGTGLSALEQPRHLCLGAPLKLPEAFQIQALVRFSFLDGSPGCHVRVPRFWSNNTILIRLSNAWNLGSPRRFVNSGSVLTVGMS